MVDIKVPSAGESVTEGRLARWLKPDGAAVQRDELVCELETDKATAEVPAPVAGILRHRAKEGDTVTIGAVIGAIDPAGAPRAAVPARPNATATPPAPADRKVPVLMPAARRAAEEQGVDPSRVAGTGRGSRILKEDVMAAATQPAKPAAQPGVVASDQKPDGEVGKPSYDRVSDRRETRVRMTGIRQRIAERLVQSQQTTATLTTFNEADLSALMALR